jgi:hypothetical protein
LLGNLSLQDINSISSALMTVHTGTVSPPADEQQMSSPAAEQQSNRAAEQLRSKLPIT